MKIRWLAAMFLAVVSAPTIAHADAAGPTDYRTEVLSITPDVPGISAQAIGGDAFFELTVDASVDVEVIVVGYRGEPYLRFSPDGTVAENRRSPTVYVNNDRLGTATPPAEADPEADPEWRTLAHGGRWAWHDHRTHWMSSTHPMGHQPGDRILEAVVPLLVGGEEVDIAVASTWEPAPSRTPATLAALAGLALGAVAVWRRGRAGGLVLALAAASALTIGLWQTWSVPAETGPPVTAWALPATALLVALAGIVRRWSSYTAAAAELVAAVQLVIWGVLRRTGLERAILPTDAPFWLDRVVTVGAAVLALVVGVSAAWRIGRILVAGDPSLRRSPVAVQPPIS